MQWTRFHAERERENAIVQVEYADSGAANAGDLVCWAVEGAPLNSNVTGGTIPSIYGLDMNILTGLRVQRHSAAIGAVQGRVAAGILLKDAAAIPVARLDSQIHPIYLAVAWGPAEVAFETATVGAIGSRFPCVPSSTHNGALTEDNTLSSTLDVLNVCAFMMQTITGPFSTSGGDGLVRVWMRCI
jgi:hypothetical protein